MSSHNTETQLEQMKGAGGARFWWVAGVPTASAAGYAKGCLAIDETNGKLYINTGSVTTATWACVGDQTA